MEEEPDREHPPDPRAEKAAARARIEQQHTWVDLQVRRAMERGEFDDLPARASRSRGSGTPTTPTGG